MLKYFIIVASNAYYFYNITLDYPVLKDFI
jgi:hypothetical protein